MKFIRPKSYQSETLSLSSRALNYGDGIFETIAIKNSRVLRWQAHRQRIQYSCQRLQLSLPDFAGLKQKIDELCLKQKQAIIKVMLTRGGGARGYCPDKNAPTAIYISLHQWPDYPISYFTHGIALKICKTRLSHNSIGAGLKHLNRLEQVMASAELTTDCIEGLMLDTNDYVIEGTRTNLFYVKDNTLITPNLHDCGVAGIMRTEILTCANHIGLACRIRQVQLVDLQQADEIFVCNSIIGIWPVNRFLNCELKVGAITRKLQAIIANQT